MAREGEGEKLVEKVIQEWFERGELKEEKREREAEKLKEEKERMIKEIEPEITKVKLPERKKIQEAQKIKSLPLQDKIEKLLILAQSEGLVFALEIAEKIGDPYLSDLFHDILAKNQLFRNFLK